MKTKCLNRAEFAIVGWSDPGGSRHLLGALLLGYYEPDSRLIYAARRSKRLRCCISGSRSAGASLIFFAAFFTDTSNRYRL